MRSVAGWCRHLTAAVVVVGCALGVAAASRAALPATGAPETQPIELRYALRTAGFTVAELALSVASEAGTTIRSELTMRGQGLVQLFSGSFTRMVALTGADGATEARPLAFEALYSKRDRTREIELRWGEDGQLTQATVSSQGRAAKPSEVPAALLQDAIDPLTALARLRAWLAAAGRAEGDTLTLPVFEGRKRLDLEARTLAPATVRLDGRRADVARIEVRLIPRDGFEPDDMFVTWPDGPQRWFEVLVSADGRYAPLAVREEGRTVIELTADCAAARC